MLEAIAWHSICQCAPGTPLPTPPPPPSRPEPIGWPTKPVLNCAETDICSALVAIQQQLQGMNTALINTLDVATSMQRFRVPFGYVGGRQHTNLTGTGTFSLSRLVGLQVIVTALPAGARELPSNPAYIWDLGWLSVSDGGGMLQQRRLARQSFTWFPDQMQDATLFGWFCNPDVAISVVELEPES